jgi:xylulokinase
MAHNVIIVDASTSAVKSYLYDLDSGAVLGSAQVDIPIQVPESGAAEVDSACWWDGLCKTVEELILTFPPSELQAITITNQQISCVFLDENGNPVAPAYLWMDTRCTEEIDRLQIRCEEDGLGTDWIVATTGIPLSDSWGLAKLLWFRSRDPEAFSRIRRVASVDAYLYEKLCGRFVTDETNACFFHMDIRNRQPATELLNYLNIDPGLFPGIVPPGTLVGSILPEVAHLSGLPEGLPVFTAASDQPCALLGMGAVAPGEAVINLGTGTFFMTPLALPLVDNRMMTNISAMPNGWLMMGTHYLTGGAMNWLRNLLTLKGEAIEFAELSRRAAEVNPGSEGLVFLPSLSGTGTPRWDPEARGMFANLGLGHTAGHFARAVMESTGYGIRNILDSFQEIGITFDKLVISGGPTSSEVWRQSLADIVQHPLSLTTLREATPKGAAMLVAVACGRFENLFEVVNCWNSPEEVIMPNMENQEVYDRMYRLYSAWTDAEASVRRQTKGETIDTIGKGK